MTIIPHLFMDYLLMFYNLGNQEAWQTGLDRKVRTPNVCSEPGAALRELKNWRSTVQRTVDTKLGLPDKSIMGPALISIFEGVFTSVVCNQALNHRYINLFYSFTNSELTNLVLFNNSVICQRLFGWDRL